MNFRPLEPHSSTLPNCATPRYDCFCCYHNSILPIKSQCPCQNNSLIYYYIIEKAFKSGKIRDRILRRGRYHVLPYIVQCIRVFIYPCIKGSPHRKVARRVATKKANARIISDSGVFRWCEWRDLNPQAFAGRF